MKINIGLHGSSGRMGREVNHLIDARADLYNLSGKYSSRDSSKQLEDLCKSSDVVIDFSNPGGLTPLLDQAVKHKTKLIICTTGLTEHQHQAISDASLDIAVLYAANTSLGANLVASLAAKAAKILQGYDIEITDWHHKNKKDAPSGTALMIGEKIAKAQNRKLADISVFDRCNQDKHEENKIGFSAIRAGGIFGKHDVIFASSNEIVEIKHEALNRTGFADGALTAAKWIMDKKHGLYSMEDIFKSII